ncbi:hypothetical protein BsWGS_20696 [Bradybaena similaris]
MEHRITVMFSIVIVAFSCSESLPAENSKAAEETSYAINITYFNETHTYLTVHSQLLRLLCALLAPEVVETYCNVFNSSSSYA